MKRFAKANLARGHALLLFAAALACVRVASAQSDVTSSALSTAAHQAADAFAKHKAHNVAVLDFVNVESPQWDRLGQKLAADFRAQLAAQPNAPTQEDRSAILGRMATAKLSQYDLTFPAAAALAVRDSEFKAWTIALMAPHGDTIDLKFSVFAAKKEGMTAGQIATFSAEIPFSSELKAMIDLDPPAQLAGYPVAGENGISNPTCISCGPPTFPKAAARPALRARVYMVAVIEANGDVGKVVVVRGAPFGLTDAAVAAVQRWKLKPALDKNGKPVAVVQSVEIEFALH